ncbi:MAG: HK97 gp10 family phage protein [Ilumatobacteraceae bacterium]
MARRGGVEVSVLGLSELAQAMEANSREMTVAVGRALWDAAQAIGNESQNLVPVDTGNLKGSMSYERSGVTTTTPVIEIRYGTPYALYQHEKLDLYHPARDGNTAGRRGSGPTAPGTEGGSPKYLEFPFLAETSQYPTKLVERIRRHFNVVRARGTG